MPAVSQVQRRLFAIAEHNPSKLHKANKSLLKMSKVQLHDFASTSDKGLPKRAPNPSLQSMMQGKS